jgi:3-deoxy-D-manno-octulosonic-acid transferase
MREGDRGSRWPITLYRGVMRVMAPLLLLITVWQAWRKGGGWRYLQQRLGYGYGRDRRGAIWIHAASVGELKGVMPLITALAARQLPLFITTTTVSSGRLAPQLLPSAVAHLYLPLDYRWPLQRLMAAVEPRALLLMETELWPELLLTLAARHRPIVVINGRLSPRTLRAPRWLRHLYRHLLALPQAILARGEADRLAFIALGAAADRCQTIGNLKFAALTTAVVTRLNLGRRYLLAASTRPEEERLIALAWQQVAPPQWLLVIAPRHPERRHEIVRDLAPQSLALRSRGDPITAATTIYLADTLGELPALIAGAEFVVMGGSYARYGGHNLLEAAALGKGVIVGPWMDNFRDECDRLCRVGAAVQIEQIDELAPQLAAWIASPALAAAAGEAGLRLIETERGVVERYLEHLSDLLPTH